jgi:hypothetical protein
MNLQKAFDPQISPVNADGPGSCRARLPLLPGAPSAPAIAPFSLRNLRIDLRFP